LLGLHDALKVFAAEIPFMSRRRLPGRPVVALTLCAIAGAVSWNLFDIARNRAHYSREIALPGAEHVSLPPEMSSALRVLALNAREHGSMLLGLPGMFSFNLWTDLPTPTLRNVTHWFSLLNHEDQAAIIHQLDKEPRALLIVQHNILAQLLEDKFRAKGPLMDYLMARYQRAFAIEGYSLWTRRGRTIAPLATARLTSAGESGIQLLA